MAAPMEIAFSFDTTSSMCGYLNTVRQKLSAITTRLFSDVPNIRIGFLAHGDYCDLGTKYVTRAKDLVAGDRVEELLDFVQKVEGTSGGDFAECYEFVLMDARMSFSWTPGAQKALVMVGDAIPHSPEEAKNQNGLALDWEEEVNHVLGMGVRIHAVQCGNTGSLATDFWKRLSYLGKGSYLNIDQLDTIVDMFLAVCYREAGVDYFQAFEKEIHLREGSGIRPELTGMFDALRNDADEEKAISEMSGTSGYASLAPTDTSNDDDADELIKDTSSVSSVRRVHGALAAMTPRAMRASRRSELREKIQLQRLRPSTKRATQESKKRNSDTKKSTAKKGVLNVTRKLRSSTIKSTQDSINRRSERVMKPKLSAKKVIKQLREDVDPDSYILRDFPWGGWCQAATMNFRSSIGWEKRKTVGAQRATLFANNKPSVFEYSVQYPNDIRNPPVPVYFHVTEDDDINVDKNEQKPKTTWKTVINSPCMRTQVDKILRKGCKMFVRRANVSLPVKVPSQDGHIQTMKELKLLINRNYDYSWAKRWVPAGAGYWAYQRRKLHRYGMTLSQ